jgi:lactate dehydrogenase-like 2-hydroxyacid dehydrogenase
LDVAVNAAADRTGWVEMTRPVVLVPGPMNDTVMQGLPERFEVLRLWEHADPDELLRTRGADVAAVATAGQRPVDADLMDQLPGLAIVANFGVGYDTVDAVEASKRGVVVTNTPEVLDDEVADTAIGLLLMTVRELPQAERYLRAGHWPQGPYPLTPTTLRGRTLGMVGMGRIASAIAARAAGFGVPVVYHSRRENPVAEHPYYPKLLDMARDVDTLVVAVPGGAATRHLVDGQVLEALGPDGVLVNVARGSVVDEQALVEALRSGTIRSAGLDVYEHEPHVPGELMALDNVVLLPHVGSASVATRAAMGDLVVANLRSWFEHGRPLTPVPESTDAAVQ